MPLLPPSSREDLVNAATHHFLLITSTAPRVHAEARRSCAAFRETKPLPSTTLFYDPRAMLPRAMSARVEGRGRLTLTRDMLGVSPLYYRAVPGGWACATRVALLRRLSPRIDAVLKSHLSINLLNLDGLVDSWESVWDGIYRVPPGATLTFAPGLVAPLRGERVDPAIKDWDERAYSATRFLGELRGALDRAGEPDAPLAISSGVDSTLLGMLSRHGARKDAPFASISYPGFPRADETRDVKQIARALEKPLLLWDATSSRPASLEGLAGLEAFVDDMPHMHPGAHYEVAFDRWLHEQTGATHKISGAIGDQLMDVPDYWVIRQLLRARPSIQRERELRFWFERAPAAVLRHVVGSSPIGQSIRARRSTRGVRLLEHFPAWRGVIPEDVVLPDVLSDGMSARARASVRPHASALSHTLRSWRWELNMRELRIHHTKSPLQGIFPFLDEQLWEWMLAAPPWLLLGGSDMGPGRLRDKRLLRRAHALEGALPANIAWRGKAAFLESFVHASMSQEGFPLLEQWSADMALEDAGVLERGATSRLLSRIARGGVSLDVIWSPVAGLWSIFALERWVRKLSLSIV